MTITCDVFKVLRHHEMAQLIANGTFAGSPDDLRDGFIHLSTIEQVAGTLAKHFENEQNLLCAGLSAAHLTPNLRWETSRGGKSFPHLYSELSIKVVRVIVPISDENRADFPRRVIFGESGALK